MNLIVCIDERNGMLFHQKRVSQDILQRKDVYAYIKEQPLYIKKKSEALYEHKNIVVIDDFYKIAHMEGYCIAEEELEETLLQKMNHIIVYCWNRHYQADTYFKIPQNFQCEQVKEFRGYSHEKITRKVYRRNHDA